MIQILGIIGGVIAIVMGINALRKGEIALTKNRPLTGNQALIAGIATIGFGFLVIIFMLIGLPLLLA